MSKPALIILALCLVSAIAADSHLTSNKKNNASSKSIRNTTEIFKVSRDTIQVNIEGRLSRGLLVNGKYYAFYEVRNPVSSLPNKKFYIIASNGKILKEINVPKGINEDTYYRLSYWQGRIIVNTQFYKNSYYLDEANGKFLKQPIFTDIPLFEDRNYQITCNCQGEFGSTIYFNNRLNGRRDSVNSGCPFLVNKVGGRYFVNTTGMVSSDIISVTPPTKLNETESNTPGTGIKPLSIVTIFRNDNLAPHFFIPASFVAGGVLYHIYNSISNEDLHLANKKERVYTTRNEVKIGVINNGGFKSLYTLKDKFDIELEQQLATGNQICTFHTEQRVLIGFKKDIPPYREAKYGFIEINGNKIAIHYFNSKKQIN